LGEYGEPPHEKPFRCPLLYKDKKDFNAFQIFWWKFRNKTSLSRRTFVVGSGVEPLAHYCSGNCSTVDIWLSLSYHNHFI